VPLGAQRLADDEERAHPERQSNPGLAVSELLARRPRDFDKWRRWGDASNQQMTSYMPCEEPPTSISASTAWLLVGLVLAGSSVACSAENADGALPQGSGGGSSAGSSTSGGGASAGSGIAGAGGQGPVGGGSAGNAATAGGAGESQGGSVSGGAGAGGEGGGPAGRAFRRVGYLRGRGDLKGWKDRLDFALVSHVVLAFAGVDAQGNVTYGDAALADFVARAHAEGAKVCLALGGGGTNGGLGTLANLIAPGNRAGFIQKIADYAEQHQLDCIDVDFEGPGVNADYGGFVAALAPALHEDGRQLSAALASWYGAQVTDEAIVAFDFVNVMAYDLHNPAGKTTPVNGASLADSKQEIDYWVERGLDRSKAVLGVPFYGYRWTSDGGKGEAVTYANILSTYGAAAASSDRIEDGGTTIYFDSRETVIAKAKLGKDYGGTMIWELSQDAAEDAALLRAMHEAD
jgi:hypothetical protein